MALRPVVSRQNLPTSLCCLKPSFQSKKMLEFNINRRTGAIVVVGSVILAMAREAILRPEIAFGLDLRMVALEQKIEVAKGGVRESAESLLDAKALLESESWREAQKALRRSFSNLKLDIYTIIQSKRGSERPQLRKLYFDLFNNATKCRQVVKDFVTSIRSIKSVGIEEPDSVFALWI